MKAACATSEPTGSIATFSIGRAASPLEDTIRGFEALKEAGKILSYGVSNFHTNEFEHFAALAGVENIACNQILYHPSKRTVENHIIP